MRETEIVAIIPARYASSRLPGKPLKEIAGKPMIYHVYARASSAQTVSRVLVATDDKRIAQVVRAFGGEVRMTSPHHRTGTDRVTEVARELSSPIIVNVQGDEPLLDPRCIDQVVLPLLGDPSLPMSTLRTPFRSPEGINNPNIVKVVVDQKDYALYFSRSPIPYFRNPVPGLSVCKHLGLYAYRRDFLLSFASLPPTPLELAEGLEQLRVLEYGYRIKVPITDWDSISVDTPEDLERVRRIFEAQK